MTLLAERPTRQVMTRSSRPDFRLHGELQLAALPTAVICAQLFVKYTLESWRLGELNEPARQIVTELISRAVLTTGITELHPRWVELHDLKLITVRLLVIEQRLIVEVTDTDPAFNATDESTRLTVVPSLCKRWNYYLPPTGGKVVWGELLLGAPTPSLDQTLEFARPLPRRVPRQEPVDPIEVTRHVAPSLGACARSTTIHPEVTT